MNKPILEIPGEVRRCGAFGLGDHVSVVVVQVARCARRGQPVEWLIAVGRTALRAGAIADAVVNIGFGSRSRVRGRCQSIQRVVAVSMRAALIDVPFIQPSQLTSEPKCQ